jgi:hypothetical protein
MGYDKYFWADLTGGIQGLFFVNCFPFDERTDFCHEHH